MVLVEEECRRYSDAFASLQETYQLGNLPQHFSRIQNFELATARVLKILSGFYSSLGFDWLSRNDAGWALGGRGWLEGRDWE